MTLSAPTLVQQLGYLATGAQLAPLHATATATLDEVRSLQGDSMMAAEGFTSLDRRVMALEAAVTLSTQQ